MKKPSRPYICGREKINSIYWKYKSGHLTDKEMLKFLSIHTALDLFASMKTLEDIKRNTFYSGMALLNLTHSWYALRERLYKEYKEKQDEYERWLLTRPVYKKSHRRKIPSHSGK